MPFIESDISTLNINAFSTIGKDWDLITAGDKNRFNTMTASWGGLGVIWQKNVSFIFIRPQRYTFEFIEKSDYYSISFLGKEYKDILSFCGRTSGRNTDKVAETGLTTIFDQEAPYFEQSNLVLICKKMYGQFIDPLCFIDKSIENEYKNQDYHKMFIGEIVKCLIRDKNE